ncbi:hypothetical protein CK936_35225 [Streptomyces albireticuli]|uniref:Uncharacterized protein n=1 Tax=Streptomyces albireticuli TaxID=1940 RepID=A0A2A2CYZ6_9ACTN|nr:hypothetical protein CK936_35225 [Streptomyces albireticuli]
MADGLLPGADLRRPNVLTSGLAREFALAVRRDLALDFAGSVETGHRRQSAECALRRNAARTGETCLTPNKVSAGQGPDPTETEAQAEAARSAHAEVSRLPGLCSGAGALRE